jgi:hypothetical protein
VHNLSAYSTILDIRSLCSRWIQASIPDASSNCVRVWLAIFALLQDADDEVRDEARAAVADAFSVLVGAWYSPQVAGVAAAALLVHPLPVRVADVLDTIDRAWAALCPPTPLERPSAVLRCCVAAFAGSHGVTAVLSENSALTLGHVLLVLHAASGALGAEDVAAALSECLVSEIAKTGQHAEFSNLRVVSPNPTTGVRVDAKAPELPTAVEMLSRPLFTRDDDNEFTDALSVSFLASVHCAAALAYTDGGVAASPAAQTLAAAVAQADFHALRQSVGAVFPTSSALQSALYPLDTVPCASDACMLAQIDRRDAWIGGVAWHPLLLRWAYALTVGAALPHLVVNLSSSLAFTHSA